MIHLFGKLQTANRSWCSGADDRLLFQSTSGTSSFVRVEHSQCTVGLGGVQIRSACRISGRGTAHASVALSAGDFEDDRA